MCARKTHASTTTTRTRWFRRMTLRIFEGRKTAANTCPVEWCAQLSFRVEAVFADDRSGSRCGDELEQRPARFRCTRTRHDGARAPGGFLKLCRQRTEIVNARIVR